MIYVGINKDISITEKYPEAIPWDLKIFQNDCKSSQFN